MATTTPDPSNLPARDPGTHFRGVLADAVAADQAAPRMVTGYCPMCARGWPIVNGHYHHSPADASAVLMPCTGEHAPGLRDRPTQYCFWCSIGSPTDERGQHHVDGDIHQCTGQQVPQAQPAEADEVARLTAERDTARAEVAQLKSKLVIGQTYRGKSLEQYRGDANKDAARYGHDPAWKAFEKFRSASTPPDKWSYGELYSAVCVALTQESVPAWNGDGTGIVTQMIGTALTRAECAEAERDQARRERDEAREALENIKNFDAFSSMQNWPDCMAIVQDIAIAALALEVK